MAIVYISHQMGAGGPEIGMALAQRLGDRYVNQELLLDAARRDGLAEDRLSHLDESKPTLFERFDTGTRPHNTALPTPCLAFPGDDNAGPRRVRGPWRHGYRWRWRRTGRRGATGSPLRRTPASCPWRAPPPSSARSKLRARCRACAR